MVELLLVQRISAKVFSADEHSRGRGEYGEGGEQSGRFRACQREISPFRSQISSANITWWRPWLKAMRFF